MTVPGGGSQYFLYCVNYKITKIANFLNSQFNFHRALQINPPFHFFKITGG